MYTMVPDTDRNLHPTFTAKVQVLVTPSCLTLCDPMDCSQPGSSVHGILQARLQEWAVVHFSRDLPNPGIEPKSPALQVDSLLPEPPGKPSQTVSGIKQLNVH